MPTDVAETCSENGRPYGASLLQLSPILEKADPVRPKIESHNEKFSVINVQFV